ncbi:MAG: hypothetical protein H6710_24980, partial [Myxococcales bacterium]|nr:hypothetical protein [Myxococcales bacterium]
MGVAAAPGADDPLRHAKALAAGLRAAGDPRGELLALEIAAVEASDLEGALAAMRGLSARRVSSGLDAPDLRCSPRTWTASGLIGSAGAYVGQHAPLATWRGTEGLGAIRLQTVSAYDDLLRAIEEAAARWPRLARFEIRLDGERLAALSDATRDRITHLTTATWTRGLTIPPMPSLRVLKASFAEEVEHLATPALERFEGHLDRIDGPSLARSAPRLRALAADSV